MEVIKDERIITVNFDALELKAIIQTISDAEDHLINTSLRLSGRADETEDETLKGKYADLACKHSATATATGRVKNQFRAALQ